MVGASGGIPWALLMIPILILVVVGPAVFFWYKYFKSRKALFEISFAGGKIAFDTTWLNTQEIQDFQRNLRLIKVAFEEQREAKSVPIAVAPQASDELKKYKDLLDSGAISQDEYETAKSKLLGTL
jgi:hypothetical protein